MIVSMLVFALNMFFVQHSLPQKSSLQLADFKTVNPTSTANGFTVLELFTSEGCSSCPSADAALLDLAQQPNVFVLGYHVTYWNRLGWKDAFSQKNFDDRQYAYSERLKGDGVYTPEVVINGVEDCVGSKKSFIEQKIANAQKKVALVQISLKVEDKTDASVKLNWQLNGDANLDDLNFALVETNCSTNVKRGENGGRTLTHVNVVRTLKTQALNGEKSGTTVLVLPNEAQKNNLKVIAFIQQKNLGKIIGAAGLNL